MFCSKCGKEISGEKFCPYCGNEVAVEVETKAAETDVKTEITWESVVKSEEATIVPPHKFDIKRMPKKMVIGVVAAVVAIVVIVVIIATATTGPDLKNIYKKYCNDIWADLGSDGSYLFIDTNPYDVEDSGVAYGDAYRAIEKVNKALGLPESLFNEMGQTTAADGKQTEEYENITVSWKYHPDKGCEVTYKKK